MNWLAFEQRKAQLLMFAGISYAEYILGKTLGDGSTMPYTFARFWDRIA